jgi:glycosyltransferase involved in cell wall biosynthesis
MQTLLRAWLQIEAKQPDAVLLLVGDGPQRAVAKRLSNKIGLKSCVWVGHVEHSVVADYLSVMDVGVGPYTKEALAFVSPLKVIEYTAMALPVVAAGGGQIKDLIEHGVTGYTYDPGSAEDLAKYILKLLHEPEKAKDMGEKAHMRLRNGWHSWNRVADNILSICRGVVK